MRYNYNEFTRFCMQRNQNIRLDGDMVWSGRIPIPESLIKRIFFSAEKLIGIYLDHLVSSIAIAVYDLVHDTNILDQVPSDTYVKENSQLLKAVFEFSKSYKKFSDLENFAVGASGLRNYEKLTSATFIETLKHKGKKYERIYVPKKIKDAITSTAPKINGKVGISNGDMFGNVIADELNIYRSGFSDAFASIFKEYLEFKLEHFGPLDPSLSSLGLAHEESYPEIGSVIMSKHQSSSLWEPSLGMAGVINANVNDAHPLLLSDFIDDRARLNLLMLALAHEEMYIINDSEKELVEAYRQRVSTTLKGFLDSLATTSSTSFE